MASPWKMPAEADSVRGKLTDVRRLLLNGGEVCQRHSHEAIVETEPGRKGQGEAKERGPALVNAVEERIRIEHRRIGGCDSYALNEEVQEKSLAAVLPAHAGVGALEDTAAGGNIKDVGIGRVHGQVVDAQIQDSLAGRHPGRPSVRRFEDSRLLRAHEDDLRTFGMQNQIPEPAVGQSLRGWKPLTAAVQRFENTIGTRGVKDLRIARSDGQSRGLSALGAEQDPLAGCQGEAALDPQQKEQEQRAHALKMHRNPRWLNRPCLRGC